MSCERSSITDIDAMTPKQLGIAVAGEVLGWRFGYEWEEGDIGVWSDPHLDYLMVLRPAHPDDPYFDVTGSRWAPWTDKNDMWEVVELFRRGWNGHAAAFVQITIYDSVMIPDTCAIIFAPDIAEVEGWSSNACEAVLQAALKAVRGEE